MDNVELINQGIEGRMGFAFLSHSLSFSFKRQLFSQCESFWNSQTRTRIEEKKKKKNALTISQLKRLCFYMPNPMFLSHGAAAVLF